MRNTVFAKAVLAAFGGSLAVIMPIIPAGANAFQVCNEAALYCKYGNWKELGIYETFPECMAAENEIRCGDQFAKLEGGTLAIRSNSLEHERLN